MVFNDYSKKEIDEIKNKYLEKIKNIENSFKKLNDNELKIKTIQFKNRIAIGEKEDSILPEAFAIVKEMIHRLMGIELYDVQILGGIILHQGRIAEMKTGEGKTLVATLPAYLNALFNKKVHIITVNDYLANRDGEITRPIFEALGLSVGIITSKTINRKEQYQCDIVYITNNELGFDYLKDNMIYDKDKKVQNKFDYAIIDEIDSILIDEARTPLIISGPSTETTHIYNIVNAFVKSLTEEDIQIDKKLKTVTLTDKGITKTEKVFNLSNYSAPQYNSLRYYIKQSLQAIFYLKKDINYVIRDNKILLVDEFTGRIADGKKYSHGLHQAIEAKEGLSIKGENNTLATITYQDLFMKYKKISGMSGTVATEQKEFNEIYKLDVVIVPTNKPIKRVDKEDKLFVNEKAKIQAIIDEVIETHKTGRPILIVTPSIEKSEKLSILLNELNIKHQLLNAKNDELEANIIKKAGEINTITIATNMVGRGTDIKISDEVKKIGGLKVIGMERGENRRIDNQIRGRTGRQGDVGESQFYTSLEDSLVIYSTNKYKNLISLEGLGTNKLSLKEIKNKSLKKIIDNGQKQLEDINFDIRKNSIKYDHIANKQREILYKQRDDILFCKFDLIAHTQKLIRECLINIVNNYYEKEDDYLEIILQKIEEICPIFLSNNFKEQKYSKDELIMKLYDTLNKQFVMILNYIKCDEEVLRLIYLTNIDITLRYLIETSVEIKRNIKLLAYKNVEPFDFYVLKMNEIFEYYTLTLKKSVIKNIFLLK